MAKKPSNTKKPTPKQRFSRHYYALMPDKKRHRIVIWVVFLVVAVAIGIQMAYPLNRALPLARLGGTPVGGQLELDLARTIAGSFPDAKVRLKAGGKITDELMLVSAGAQPNTDTMVRTLTEYPFWQRFIPGSILFNVPRVTTWSVDYAPQRLDVFAAEQAERLSFAPTNAGLAIHDGRLVATPDTPGRSVAAARVSRALVTVRPEYGRTTTVEMVADRKPAAKTAADLESVKDQASAALNLPLSIQAGGRTFVPEQAERAAWLRLSEDESGRTALTIDEPRLNAYIDDTITAQAGKPAGRTNIGLQNGREVSRQEGESGLKVDNVQLVDLLSDYLLRGIGQPPFIGEMLTVEPTIVYNNTYTATQEGLQAYISEKAKHGAWISIQQLDGQRWTAGADDHDSVVSGSTYKLYVSLYLFKEMDEGKRDWGTPILDTTTDVCFDRMTVASTNPCAEEWLRQLGRSTVNEYLYSKGFSTATTFTHPEASHTSAADLTKFMVGLEQGTLVNGGHRDRLLKSLSTHPYRYGIPAGSKGQVWDKVGFVFDYINDTAIVHHPKGTYVMTILTQGQSYGAIATMTREIEKIMYP